MRRPVFNFDENEDCSGRSMGKQYVSGILPKGLNFEDSSSNRISAVGFILEVEDDLAVGTLVSGGDEHWVLL